jgi:polyphosphate glucokinase
MSGRAVLAVDVGGSHVKGLVSERDEPRKLKSGRRLSAARMVEKVLELTAGWAYDRVSVGVPAQVRAGRVVHDPVNLGPGWVGFDYAAAFGRPTIVIVNALEPATSCSAAETSTS